MTTAPLLELRGLVRSVPNVERPLLDITQFRLDPSERVGVSGNSGSGKSTLLRVLSMLDPWDRGELRFHGDQVSADTVPPFRRQVIYLQQRPSLVPQSVRDNLQLPFRLACSSARYDEAKAVALLGQLAKPPSMLDQPSDSLSGGERQVVSLVRALQLDPQLLLLDEPTASLDSDSASRIETTLLRWQQASPTRAFLLVSHDSEQLRRMTSRTVRLDFGRIVEGADDA